LLIEPQALPMEPPRLLAISPGIGELPSGVQRAGQRGCPRRRCPRQQRRQALPGIRALADVARDRVIERAGRRGEPGAQRQSM